MDHCERDDSDDDDDNDNDNDAVACERTECNDDKAATTDDGVDAVVAAARTGEGEGDAEI